MRYWEYNNLDPRKNQEGSFSFDPVSQSVYFQQRERFIEFWSNLEPQKREIIVGNIGEIWKTVQEEKKQKHNIPQILLIGNF